jgi:hypothetical protein
MLTPRAPQQVHTIRHHATALGYAEALPNARIRHYVIGFKTGQLARKIMYAMEDRPSVRLYRSMFHTPVSASGNGSRVSLDVAAAVHISKACPPKEFHPHSEFDLCHVHSVNMDDFLRYPFHRNIGIILSYAVLDETDQEVVLRSHVIELPGENDDDDEEVADKRQDEDDEFRQHLQWLYTKE